MKRLLTKALLSCRDSWHLEFCLPGLKSHEILIGVMGSHEKLVLCRQNCPKQREE